MKHSCPEELREEEMRNNDKQNSAFAISDIWTKIAVEE